MTLDDAVLLRQLAGKPAERVLLADLAEFSQATASCPNCPGVEHGRGRVTGGPVSAGFWFCVSDRPGVGADDLLWLVLLVDRADGVIVDDDPDTAFEQTPLSSGSNNFSLLVPLTMWASWETVIGVPVGAFVITVKCASAGGRNKSPREFIAELELVLARRPSYFFQPEVNAVHARGFG